MKVNSIITSESAKRMLGYIRNVYDNDRFMPTLFQVAGIEIDELWQWVHEIREQASPVTATWGLRYWEQLIGFPVNETMPIEERRARILVWMTSEWPVSRKRMETIVSEASGLAARIEDRIAPYTFRVHITWDKDSPLNLVRVQRAIEEAKPAHLAYEMAINNPTQVGLATSSQTYEVKEFYCGTFFAGQRPGGVY